MNCNKSFQVGVIALGGNLPSVVGDPAKTLVEALVALSQRGVVIRRISRFFETPCFPAGAGPDYVNAAAVIEWSGEPGAFLAQLHRVEAEFGRERVQRWGMRTLDIDLIAFGETVLPDRETYGRWRTLSADAQREEAPDQIILPHPRLHERAFVLVPMADVFPDWTHPWDGRSVSEMLKAQEPDEIASVKPV